MIASRSASITLALFLAGCATSAPDLSVEAPVALDDAEIAEAA
jgi:starvation-inducible outer membrane lipoprotein